MFFTFISAFSVHPYLFFPRFIPICNFLKFYFSSIAPPLFFLLTIFKEMLNLAISYRRHFCGPGGGGHCRVLNRWCGIRLCKQWKYKITNVPRGTCHCCREKSVSGAPPRIPLNSKLILER